MPGDVEERKLESILDELKKLDEFSRDADLKLREFAKRVFGNVRVANEETRSSSPSASDFCENAMFFIRKIGEAITSISLEADSMMRELPEDPKTMLTSEHRAKLAKLKEGSWQ